MKSKPDLLILRLAFAVILVYAAIGKIQDPVDFSLTIEAYRIVGPLAARWLAIGLPWMELFVALLLLFRGSLQRTATYLNFGLMLIFLIAVLQAWLRGLSIDCGCFGGDNSDIDAWKVLQNVGLFLFSGYMIWRAHNFRRFFHVSPDF